MNGRARATAASARVEVATVAARRDRTITAAMASMARPATTVQGGQVAVAVIRGITATPATTEVDQVGIAAAPATTEVDRVGIAEITIDPVADTGVALATTMAVVRTMVAQGTAMAGDPTIGAATGDITIAAVVIMAVLMDTASRITADTATTDPMATLTARDMDTIIGAAYGSRYRA